MTDTVYDFLEPIPHYKMSETMVLDAMQWRYIFPINEEEEIPYYLPQMELFEKLGMHFRVTLNRYETYVYNGATDNYEIYYGKYDRKKGQQIWGNLPFETSTVQDGSRSRRLYSIRVLHSNGTYVFANPTDFSSYSLFTIYNKEYLGNETMTNKRRNTNEKGTSELYVTTDGIFHLINLLPTPMYLNSAICGGIAMPIINHLKKDGKNYAFPNPDVFFYKVYADTNDGNVERNNIPIPAGKRFSINGQDFISLGDTMALRCV